MNGLNKIAEQFTPNIAATSGYFSPQRVNQSAKTSDISFEDILSAKQKELTEGQPLRFSKHANARLESRGIDLTLEQTARLESGVNQAMEKGIKESLVLIDSLAFIVNVPSKTVVTAMDQTETDRNVFTNIDGAVIN